MSPYRELVTNGTGWLRAIAQGSTLLSAIAIVLVWTGIIVVLDMKRSDVEREAVQNSANLALAFEEHLSRSLNEIDRSLKIIRTNYLLEPKGFNLKNWLRISQVFDDQTLQVAIVGPGGFITQSSIETSSSVGTDLRDREHFRHFIAAKGDELFISKPVIGRTTGKWSIQLARRVEQKDGSFGGIVVASLDPNYLSRFYSSINVGKNGYVRVIGTDGIIRAVGGQTTGVLGTDLSSAALFKHFNNRPSGWYYTESDFSDRIPRLSTYRGVKNYPLVVAVGLSQAELFSGIRTEQHWYRILAAALTLVILIINGLSIRGQLLRERLTQDLRIQNLRFNALLSDMPLGVCMFDSASRLAISNDRYLQMFGLQADTALPGQSFIDIIRHRKASGTFSGDVEPFCSELVEGLNQGLLMRNLSHLSDGRVISSLNQAMEGGGWVSIHEDITEQQIAKLRLEQTKKFLDSIIENVPTPVVVKEPYTQRIVLVNQAYEKFVGLQRQNIVGSTAFDLFSLKDAELVAKCDKDAMSVNQQPITSEFSVETPANGVRNVSTTRLVVLDENDRPEYLIAVIDDTTEKKKAEAKIAHMAHYDSVTGLRNRARFAEDLEESLASLRGEERLTILLLDLDHFKHVNDTFGHLVGDELLKAVAERLGKCVPEPDRIARLGGDEFAILHVGGNHESDISDLAHRIRVAIVAPYDLGGLQAAVDVSIGSSCAPIDTTEALDLMKNADMALYKAKGAGRGIYRRFEPEMITGIAARHALEVNLRCAIANDEFELLYQPILNIEDNRIVCLEGLLHWHHPIHGILSAADFIPVAVETGLIIPLGKWVIRQACCDAARWPDDIKVAVNLSPVQFRSHDLAQEVIQALEASGVAPNRLELEITEEMLLGHSRENLAVLDQLRSLGVQIVMDDFGTGYSSLNYLRLFPFDKIKIDRSFINELSDGNNISLAIVQAVARLANVLSVPVTAEGVETADQLALVRAAGCTEYQGYLFSVPKPAVEIMELLHGSTLAKITAA
jgi:diguanylate cyclase (GGDEF)-like protein/PAS domain S-box-containing protein